MDMRFVKCDAVLRLFVVPCFACTNLYPFPHGVTGGHFSLRNDGYRLVAPRM